MRRIPDHAISLWIEGDELKLGIPQPKGEDRKFTVAFLSIPTRKCSVENSEWGEPLARQRGWLILLDLLRQRERAGRATIGRKANPVQYDVNKMLLAMQTPEAKARASKAAAQRAASGPPEELLRELGLI